MDYHRIVDAIAPDDPVLNEPKVLKAKGTYDDAVREAKYKAAVKALEKLKDAIGGRGRPPALSVRIESADIGEDRTVRLIVTNKSNEDLVLNSIYCNADVWKEDVLVEVPVIRSGDSVQVPIKIGDGLTSTAVLHVVIGYTRDLIPVKQKFAFKIFSDKDGSLEV